MVTRLQGSLLRYYVKQKDYWEDASDETCFYSWICIYSGNLKFSIYCQPLYQLLRKHQSIGGYAFGWGSGCEILSCF